MAVRPTDPEALHLFEIIGAPLLAIVQAEAQAVQVSAEYMRRIGFGEPGEKEGAKQTLQNGGDLGPLRTAKFQLDRVGPDGQAVKREVTIPVLSLFPIPLMQVKEAEVDIHVRILSRVPLADDVRDKGTPESMRKDFLSEDRIELKGFLSPASGGSATNQANLKMKIRMSQSDMPAGLTHLLALMRDSIKDGPAPQAGNLVPSDGNPGQPPPLP
jgi:hypothetical protein